jgi:hypothetical protein
MLKRITITFATIILFTTVARSQFLSDAVRLGSEPIGTGARAISMGGTGIATANDYSALDWNPAALTLINAGEVNFSLYFKGHNSTASFLGTSADQSVTNTALGSFAYASAVPTRQGHLAFGISYDRVQDYNTTYSFSAVNPNSSFLNTQGFVNDPGFNSRNQKYSDYLSNLQQNNLAWQLYLTNPIADTLNPKLTTQFGKAGLLQTGTVTEEGGMNAIRIGGGIDVSENVSLGATANFFIGSYDYRRDYTERDINNVIPSLDSVPPNGFKSATIVDTRHQSQTGINLKLGLLATPSSFFSFGFTFETPTAYSVNDQFQRTGSSVFKDGSTYSSLSFQQNPDVSSLNPTIVNNYTVTTPMKFAGGVAFKAAGLTVSAAADFSDQSQLRYSDADVDLSDLNDSARADLKAVLNWKLGAEYVIKPLGLILRAGYAMNPSPYKGDPSNFNTTNISGGIGILLSSSAIAEITYRRTSYRTDHLLYSDIDITSGALVTAAIPTDDVVQNLVMVSFSFRF